MILVKAGKRGTLLERCFGAEALEPTRLACLKNRVARNQRTKSRILHLHIRHHMNIEAVKILA